MRSGRYGSSGGSKSHKTTGGFNETTGTATEGDRADFSRSFNFGLSRTKGQNQTHTSAPWNDEVELVSHAQGRSTHGSEFDETEESHKGIMRKTEVTHVVTYTVDEEDKSSQAGSR